MESALIVFLIAIANGGMDLIKFNPTDFVFQSDWWLAKGKYSWDKRSWLSKQLGVYSDGWHHLKGWLLIGIILLPFSLVHTPYWFMVLWLIGAWFGGHNLGYYVIWRRSTWEIFIEISKTTFNVIIGVRI